MQTFDNWTNIQYWSNGLQRATNLTYTSKFLYNTPTWPKIGVTQKLKVTHETKPQIHQRNTFQRDLPIKM